MILAVEKKIEVLHSIFNVLIKILNLLTLPELNHEFISERKIEKKLPESVHKFVFAQQKKSRF